MSMKPISARRARTRSRLIEAASEVMAEKGIEDATLDEIAARAGMTKGAIYDNFETKYDLILAVIMAKAAYPQRPAIEPGATLRQNLRRIGESTAAFLPTAEAQAGPSAQLELYALAHEGMRQRISGFYARRVAFGEAFLRELAEINPLPMPADQFAILMSVLAAGLIHHRLMAPGMITDEFVISAFEALAPDDGSSAPT